MNIPNLPNMPSFPPPMFGQPQQMAPAGEIVWVQSPEQLNALQLPPNVSRLYMNSGTAEFYIITTDKIGMKTTATYTFAEKPVPAPVEYVTKAEFAELVSLLKGAKNNEPHPEEQRTKATESERLGAHETANLPAVIKPNDYSGQTAGNFRG